MDLPRAPTSPPKGFIFTPIIVSMVGMAITAIVLVLYHFVVSKYCTRERPAAAATNPQSQKGSGVEEWVLNTIPIHIYSKHQSGAFSVDQSGCPVCLGELEEGEVFRLLPNCHHLFHVECIDQWFLSHSNCPLCRSPIVPTPSHAILSTPMVEAVEGENRSLTQFPARSVTKLPPCALMVLPCERRPQVFLGGLKRSLSMDYISLIIQPDVRSSSTSSSSSSKPACLRSCSSQKHFDRTASVLTKSFSWLRPGSTRDVAGSLPL